MANPGAIIAAGILGGLGAVMGQAIKESLHHIITKNAAFEQARKLSNGKGILNLGCGPHRTYQAQMIAEQPEVLGNIDIAPNGMPHFIQLDIETERLPFADKQFGCVFASHILEHLDNWQFALEEIVRVADWVVVVLPHPTNFGGWLDPEHRQHFSVDDIYEIAQIPNVTVYY